MADPNRRVMADPNLRVMAGPNPRVMAARRPRVMAGPNARVIAALSPRVMAGLGPATHDFNPPSRMPLFQAKSPGDSTRIRRCHAARNAPVTHQHTSRPNIRPTPR
jgi:hypothetical protein